MSYTESDAYEEIAKYVEDNKIGYVKGVVETMTRSQLLRPTNTQEQMEKLSIRLNKLKTKLE